MQKTILNVHSEIIDRVHGMDGVLNMMIMMFGGAVPEEQRPPDLELYGLISFLENEALSLLTVVENAEIQLPKPLWDAAYQARAITLCTATVVRETELEWPFGDSTTDQLVGAVRRCIALIGAASAEMTRVSPDTAEPPEVVPTQVNVRARAIAKRSSRIAVAQ